MKSQKNFSLTIKDSIPVDIEKIIEYHYGMNIIPTPGLRNLIDMDGFITSDFSAIYVDDWVYTHVYNRYRFTLAHEIGHYYIHGDYLKQFNFNSIKDWMIFMSNLDHKEHSKMEYQAYFFAGLILVPQDNLKEEFNKAILNANELIEKSHVDREIYLPYVIENIAKELSQIFKASIDVIKRRIYIDDLQSLIP